MITNETKDSLPKEETKKAINPKIDELIKVEKDLNLATARQEELNKAKEQNEATKKELEELKTKIAELKAKREEIISWTKKSLWAEKNPDESVLEEVKYEKTPDEKERQSAQKILVQFNENPEKVDFQNVEWGILWIVLGLLKAFFWWTWQMNSDTWNVENTVSEPEEIKQVETKITDPKREIWNFDFETLIQTKEWKKFEKYRGLMIKYSTRFNIEPWILLKLFIKEWSHWNINAKPPNGTALWLGQITNDTWKIICKEIWPKQYWIPINVEEDRYDAEKQILASCMYLDYCARLRQVDHATAILYYHMWPWKINDKKAQTYIEWNPAIARFHWNWPVTVQSYEEAAKRYYLS